MALLSLALSVRYGTTAVLDRVELEMARGETLALVGPSGSGKSTIALAILRLLPFAGATASGRISFQGQDLMSASEATMRGLRGKQISLVLQSASAALNPALRLESHLREAWCAHSGEPWEGQRARIQDIMRGFGLPAGDEFLRRYPRQISVGQAQRVLIAMSLVHRPSLLIADEVTSALDAITRREVIDCLRMANVQWGTAVLFITHELAAAAAFCRRIAILHEGRIVESDTCERLLSSPHHPYTRLLVEASLGPITPAADILSSNDGDRKSVCRPEWPVTS